ncbi:hypothetical protein ACERZ8_13145 [Tateyamaria armeniaca]|uniref:Uncharacterized protein n=1 Tax=Tateyamaria armeniaca TaxID=2518930 RepID=A0ABW8UUM4_9RHOB
MADEVDPVEPLLLHQRRDALCCAVDIDPLGLGATVISRQAVVGDGALARRNSTERESTRIEVNAPGMPITALLARAIARSS